jgi:putative peptide zinc metalloprotease protein
VPTRRGDGQMLQLTPLLYLVLDEIDGRRSNEEIATAVSRRFGRQVTPQNVGSLVADKLRPLGVVRPADGSDPQVRRSNPLLALRFRYAVTDPERTRRLTAPFTVLFHPLLVASLLAAFGVVCWWVLFERGLAAATHEAFHKPGLLLLVFVVTVFSAGFHEFGHAAAARYGGSTPGSMGMGFYLFWPAFYTDVTDSYRLGRAGRVRTDLGGLYFNAITAVATVGLWWLTGYDAWLLVVATQILQMIRQLMPTVRFDGYHVLADLTGVPDLYHRIKPTLLGLLPWRWHDPKASDLTVKARTVVTLWCVTVVPLMVFSLAIMVITLPRLVATAWVSLQQQWGLVETGWSGGDPFAVLARCLAIIALIFPLLGIVYIVVRLVRASAAKVWVGTRGKPAQRAAAVVTAMAPGAAAPSSLATNPGDESGTTPTAAGTSTTPVGETPGAPSWVFPFDQPLPPGPGDNQTLAVNTTDETVVYDVAFALVWVDGDDPVTNTNAAYAFASCTDCAAVAVSFQVVLVVGQADVIVPQNLAGALTYNCVQCLTYALATQLVVTLNGPLSSDGMRALNAIWAELARFAEHITDYPLDELRDRLTVFEQAILDVIAADGAVTLPTTSTAPTDLAPTSEPSDPGQPSPTPGETAPGDGTTSEPAPEDPSPDAPPTTPTTGAPPDDTVQPTTSAETTTATTEDTSAPE